MPTLFIIFGYKFFFWSNEHEPAHIHVSKGDSEARFTIDPILLTDNYGFKNNELKMIESILEENIEVIKERWHEYFKNKK